MNRQMIGLGPPLLLYLVGTQCDVSMSWIDTADPIALNKRSHNELLETLLN